MTSKILSLCVLVTFILGCKAPATKTSTTVDRPYNDFGILDEPVNPTGNQVSFVSGEDFASFKRTAQAAGKPYWVYFYFDACKPCKRLNAYTFSDPKVIDFSDANLMAYKVDVEQFAGMDIAELFSIQEYPTILLFDANGQLQGSLEGFVTGDVLLAALRQLKS